MQRAIFGARYMIGEDKITVVPFVVEADDCYMTETSTKGSISVSAEDAAARPEWMSDAGEVSRDLKIEKVTAFHVGYGASALFRKLQAFEMFRHAEGTKSRFEGEFDATGAYLPVEER